MLSSPAGDKHEPEHGCRRKPLIRVPEINEGDILRGKRGVVVEEYHHFSVEEEERGDDRRKDHSLASAGEEVSLGGDGASTRSRFRSI